MTIQPDLASLSEELDACRKELAAVKEREIAHVRATGESAAVLIRERDEAVAHDLQPYPTAEDYERVCALLAAAIEERERLMEALEIGRKATEELVGYTFEDSYGKDYRSCCQSRTVYVHDADCSSLLFLQSLAALKNPPKEDAK